MKERSGNCFRLVALVMAALFVATAGAGDLVQVSDKLPFRDELLVSRAVIDECDLPRTQLEALKEEANSHGIEIASRENLSSTQPGKVLLVEIVRADSMRQGAKHIKQMAVAGKLFENGEQIGSFVAQRRSSGGMLGQVMTSCAVLKKCARSIAADAAKWLINPTQGAQLGEGRHRLQIEP